PLSILWSILVLSRSISLLASSSFLAQSVLGIRYILSSRVGVAAPDHPSYSSSKKSTGSSMRAIKGEIKSFVQEFVCFQKSGGG
ncbi:10199_t:CDS:2, partial [Acaulospora morrowiae]